jgi:CRISPR-associated protein Csb2
MSYLIISVHWLDDRYHGLKDREGPPEWPPSPYRLFQALVAGAARRGDLEGDSEKALHWLQTLKPPMIIAPRARDGQVVTRFVPNNDGDKKPDRQTRLTGKTFRPTLMLDPPNIHYFWEMNQDQVSEAETICKVARYLTCLGWGIDMAYADGQLVGEEVIPKLLGVRWFSREGVMRDNGMLRVPIFDRETGVNSLDDLKHAHGSALARIDKPLNTVEKPKVFRHVFYESKDRLLAHPHVIFELRQNDDTFFSYSQNRLIHIAGMVRHLAIERMEKSPPEGVTDDWIDTYVAGHPKAGSAEHRQFSYLPLPSIGHQQADHNVRRLMIVAPLGDDRFLRHLAIRLDGQQLKPTPETGLNQPPTLVRVRGDRFARFYTEASNTWASVTPVILPGHDDHKPEKTRKLIEKALAQIGIKERCEFEWSALSQFPKSLSSHKYDRNRRPTSYIRPNHLLTQTAVHLKLRFSDAIKVPGPLVIGAGRHCGFGILARMDA